MLTMQLLIAAPPDFCIDFLTAYLIGLLTLMIALTQFDTAVMAPSSLYCSGSLCKILGTHSHKLRLVSSMHTSRQSTTWLSSRILITIVAVVLPGCRLSCQVPTHYCYIMWSPTGFSCRTTRTSFGNMIGWPFGASGSFPCILCSREIYSIVISQGAAGLDIYGRLNPKQGEFVT